ncbi:hypothetical protein AB2E52_25050 (plasmid) [Escherichia coli]
MTSSLSQKRFVRRGKPYD